MSHIDLNINEDILQAWSHFHVTSDHVTLPLQGTLNQDPFALHQHELELIKGTRLPAWHAWTCLILIEFLYAACAAIKNWPRRQNRRRGRCAHKLKNGGWKNAAVPAVENRSVQT